MAVPVPRGRDWLWLLAGAAAVLLSRLPFLNAGYGLDGDAWLTARAAVRIAASGGYTASRLPGHPFQEISYALIWNRGAVAFNLATALLSALAFLFFALAVKQFGSRDYILASLALAFTPVIYINSTNAMDYIWALAFILGSLYFVTRWHPLIAGAFLGLAVGCRVTSALMVLPLAILLLSRGRDRRAVKAVLLFGLAAGLAGIITLLPMLLTYGSGSAEFWDAATPLWLVAKRSTLEAWGVIGLAGIALAGFAMLVRPSLRKEETSIPSSVGPWTIAAWATAAVLTLLAFLRLPHEAGYLIPAVPFVILLLGRLLARKLFLLTCVALIVSSFLLNISEAGKPNSPRFSPLALTVPVPGYQLAVDPLYGPILADRSRRLAAMDYVGRAIASGRTLPDPSVVAMGDWFIQLSLSLPKDYQGAPEYVPLLNQTQLADYLKRGYHVYYLPRTLASSIAALPVEEGMADRAPQPLFMEDQP